MNKKKLARKQKAERNKSEANDAASTASERKSRFISPALLIALTGFLLYANSLSNGFALDDTSAITYNRLVKQGVSAIPEIFETSYRYGFWNGKDELYRPVPLAVFAVFWQMFPGSPLPGHIANVLLYALTGFLLYKVLKRILKNSNALIPFIASILFIAHPIHTEVVANIKSFDEINSFLFVLFTFVFVYRYLDYGSAMYLIGAWVCFFIAMLSKEGAITMIAVIPLSIVMFSHPPKASILKIIFVLIAASGVYLLMRVNVLGSLGGKKDFVMIDNVMVKAPDYSIKLATSFGILFMAIKLVLYPHPLSCDYSYPVTHLFQWDNFMPLISLLFHIGLILAAFFFLRKNKAISFAILFYFITMSLYTNIFITIRSAFSERFLYVPLLGLTLLIACLILSVFRIPPGKLPDAADSKMKLIQRKKIYVLMFLCAVLIPYSIKTIARNPDWKNDSKLFSTDVLNSPDNARLHYFFANSLFSEKGYDGTNEQKIFFLDSAIAEYTRAIKLYPEYTDALGLRGLAHEQRGANEKAFEDYEKAVALNSRNASVFNHLGVLYYNKQNYDKAVALFLKSVESDPALAEGWSHLGSAYVAIRQDEKAIGAYNKSLAVEPDNADVLLMAGQAYQRLNDEITAKKYLDKVYQLSPEKRPH